MAELLAMLEAADVEFSPHRLRAGASRVRRYREPRAIVMKKQRLIKHLRKSGCVLLRQGRHEWWTNEASGERTSVPRHTEISDVLAMKISRDLGVAAP